MENNKRKDKKGGLFSYILEKYKESNGSSFVQISFYHLGIYDKYIKLLQEKGQAAFPCHWLKNWDHSTRENWRKACLDQHLLRSNQQGYGVRTHASTGQHLNRLEYQKFQVAKLFIDKMKLLEFSLDPSLKGFREYKDFALVSLEAFTMTNDVKETRKMKFLRQIDKGDVLHLKVVEDCNMDFKLLVLNKYNENERVADYFIYAYMMKAYQLEKLPRPLLVNDFVRATVLGKLKMEGNIFSKLLVTFNNKIVSDKYKDIDLGLVFESEIPFYPEDISNYNSFLNYMKANKNPDNPQEVVKCMSSLGIDPYKIYSFHESGDGKKLGVPKEPSSKAELEIKEKSMSLIKEVDKQLFLGEDEKSLMGLIEEALKIYPKNDAAYAVRGQLYKKMFYTVADYGYILKALDDFEKSLDLNGYNLIATREYLSLLILSAELFKEEGNEEKSDEIMKIVERCKDIVDVTHYLAKNNSLLQQSEEDRQQNPANPSKLRS